MHADCLLSVVAVADVGANNDGGVFSGTDHRYH